MPSLRSTRIRRRGWAVLAAFLMLAALAVAAPAAWAAPLQAWFRGVGLGTVPALDDSRADLGSRALADRAPARGYLLRKGAFTPLRDIPGASLTGHLGVNDCGQIVGFYVDAGGKYHGFLLDKGAVTTIDVPGAAGGTAAFDVNNRGRIVGNYVDAGGRQRAFLLDRGVFTTIDAPGATLTTISKINDRDQIAGGYLEMATAGAMAICSSGRLHHRRCPWRHDDDGEQRQRPWPGLGRLRGWGRNPPRLPVAQGRLHHHRCAGRRLGNVPLGVNNRGDTVGGYAHAARTTHGFLLRNGVFTTIDAPGAPSGTVAHDINDRGDILIPAPGVVQLNV